MLNRLTKPTVIMVVNLLMLLLLLLLSLLLLRLLQLLLSRNLLRVLTDGLKVGFLAAVGNRPLKAGATVCDTSR